MVSPLDLYSFAIGMDPLTWRPRPRNDKSLLRRSTLPAFNKPGVDAEQIQEPATGVIDDIVDRSRTIVEGRKDRRDDGSDFGKQRHVAQVAGMQRRLADGENEPAFFF